MSIHLHEYAIECTQSVWIGLLYLCVTCEYAVCIKCVCVFQEWEVLQQSIQRRERALLETKSKVTHPVYSLFFPEEKQEWWWLYIADRRDQTLVSMPYHVCTLKDTEEVCVCVCVCTRTRLLVSQCVSFFLFQSSHLCMLGWEVCVCVCVCVCLF